MAQAQSSLAVLGGFGRWWVVSLLAAIVAAIGAHMFIGVPLGSVMDVVLALVLVGLVLMEAYLGIRAIGFLIAGRVNDAMTWLGAMVVYLLILFPPILAFNGYAYMIGQHIAGTSHLYDVITGGISSVFKLPAQLISAALVLILHAGSGYVNYVAQARTGLEIGANLLSIVVALRALAAHRASRHEDEH